MAERSKYRHQNCHNFNSSAYAIPPSKATLLNGANIKRVLSPASVKSKSASRFLNGPVMGKKLSRMSNENVQDAALGTIINVRVNGGTATTGTAKTQVGGHGPTIRTRSRVMKEPEPKPEHAKVEEARQVSETGTNGQADFEAHSISDADYIQITTPLQITTPTIRNIIPDIHYENDKHQPYKSSLVVVQQQQQQPQKVYLYQSVEQEQSRPAAYEHRQSMRHHQPVQPVKTMQDPMFDSKITPLALSTAFQVMQTWSLTYMSSRHQSMASSTKALYTKTPSSSVSSTSSLPASIPGLVANVFGSASSHMDGRISSASLNPPPLSWSPPSLHPLTPPLSPHSYFINHDERRVLLHLAGMTHRVHSLMRIGKSVLSTALIYMMRFNSITLGNPAYYHDVNIVHLKSDVYYFWCCALVSPC